MKRDDYLTLFKQMDAEGAVSRLHWASGPKAGQTEPWDADEASVPGERVRGLGASIREVDGDTVFAETLTAKPRLVIAGAGHVGRATCYVAATLGFHITVVDERPAFADPERLIGADEVICGPYADVVPALPDNPNTYYVLVSPSAQRDRVAASIILNKPSAYVGMLASKRKAALIRQGLLEDGVPSDRIDVMHTPIGLEIGGGEPTEIAVSIAAELISVRSGRKTQTFDESVRDAIEVSDEPRVLATIIAHQGSAPRGTGSRLLVGPNGYVAGTVGGGKVEMAAMTTAKAMLSGEDPSDVECLNFTLSDVGAYALGMTCGGRVRLMLERI